MRKLIELVGVASLASSSWAADYGTLYNNGHVSVWPESISGEYTRTSTPSGVNATRPVNMAAPGGRVAANTMTLAIPKRGVAVVAGRVLAAGMTWPVAAGLLAWGLYDEFRIRPKEDGTPGLVRDPGVPPEQYTVDVYCHSFGCKADPYEAAVDLAGARQAQSNNTAVIPGSVSVTDFPAPNPNKNVTWGYKFICAGDPSPGPMNCTGADSGSLIFTPSQPAERCPLATGGSKGPDGKCPTGAYTTPVSPEEAAQIAASKELTSQIDYKALLDEALGRGPVTPPPNTAVEVGNSVPFVTGPVTKTTHADGRVTEVATGWNFSRDPVKKDRGTYKPVTTTTTKDANGVPIGNPEVVQGPDPDPIPEEPGDPCKVDPDRMGCQKFGEVDDVDLEKRDKTVAYTPDAGWGADNGTCPVPTTLQSLGGQLAVDNTIICGFFTGVRWVIIGIASIAACLIFIGGIKE